MRLSGSRSIELPPQACPPPAETVSLTTRQVNVIRLLLERRDFSPEQVAALEYQALLRTPGIGRKSVQIIRCWLQQQGRDLRNSPVSEDDPGRTQRLARRLDRAAALLRRHGYRVLPPAPEPG